ncbi:hypothetical protein [Paracoccus sp. ME4]|uniref:hypothetical protein n=1 Tax=Paracoccus sp. ME4 TaxID=3138066 RepID=UPI00398A7B1C
MAQAEAGLELPIGLTEQKFLQQLARIEARAVRSAQRQQKAFVDSNQQITRSFGLMSGQARGQIQNVSFQLQDLFVQIGAGTSATQALGQQLPQLLGGFGALGAVFGTVAALAIPLAGAFLFSGEEAKSLDEAIKDLNTSLDDYNAAVEAANVPTSELAEKYGVAAGAAQLLLQQLAQLAKLDAASSLRASATAIRESFEDLPSILALVDAELSQFGEGSSGIETLADSLREKFGLTIDQARELQGILTDQQAAVTVEDQAAAMLRLAQFLGQANEQAGYTNDTLIQTNKSAAEGALSANEMAVAMEGAASAAAGVVATVDQLPGAINAATTSAVALTRALSAAIAASQAVPGSVGAPSLGRFGNGEDITRRAGGLDLQEQQTFRYDWQEQMAAAEEARRKAEQDAARRSGGGGGGGGRRSGAPRSAERPLFESIQRDLEQLEREISLIGKSNQEVATAKARWEALDEAKRRGVPVNAEMSAQIDAQAEQFGHLTAELERAEASQQQFEQAVDGIADAMAGALVAGESLRDGLAQVLKSIASDIINSGIRQALMGQFGGGGGFGGFLSGIFGGGDPLTSALRVAGLPARAMGGPVSANQPYLVGERGPEIVVPGRSGTVIPNHRIGSGGGQSVLVVELSPEVKAQILAEAEGQSVRISQQTAAAQAKALPGQVQRINAQPRRRP